MSGATQTLDVGLHDGVPANIYHADPCPAPSLSSSLARTLLHESPRHAWLDHPRLNPAHSPRATTPAMTLGTIVHALLAGDSQSIDVGAFADYKTAAARAWRDETEAAGRTPVLEKQMPEATAIADAVRASAGLGCDNGPFRGVAARNELTAVWREGDAYHRALIDRLIIDGPHADLWDWKTTADVSDRGIERRIADMGYAFQLAFYLRGLRAVMPDLAAQWSACLVFVETAPPYTVRRVYLSDAYMMHAQAEVDRACKLWAHCMQTGDWSDPRNGQSTTFELPGWLVRDDEIQID